MTKLLVPRSLNFKLDQPFLNLKEMNYIDDIQNLLDRYWDGETTLEEERRLKAYFSSDRVDPRFAAEAPFFQALREEQGVQSPKIHLAVQMPQQPRLAWYRMAAAAAVIGMITVVAWWMTHRSTDDGQQVAQINAAPTVQPIVPTAMPEAAPQVNPQQIPVPAVAEAKPKAKPRRHHPTTRPTATLASAPLDPETEKALEEVKAALVLLSSKLNKGRHAASKNLNQVETIEKYFKHKKEIEG